MTTQDLTDLKQLFEFAILTGDKPELTKSDCEMVVAAVEELMKLRQPVWRPGDSDLYSIESDLIQYHGFMLERSEEYCGYVNRKVPFGTVIERAITVIEQLRAAPDPPKVSV